MRVAPGPTLETERLILRPPADVDLDGWARLMADPDGA
ncbi:MAG TPA: N-acetyltransferase, partial [Caulobacter sp.]|nr:N-acetyltransferase [Caulobacter sp.]